MMVAAGGEHVLIGLSERNLELLREGRPIALDLAQFNLKGRLLIFYGETEEKMRAEMAEFIGPDTVVTDNTRKQ